MIGLCIIKDVAVCFSWAKLLFNTMLTKVLQIKLVLIVVFFLIGQPFEVNKENGGCTLH